MKNLPLNIHYRYFNFVNYILINILIITLSIHMQNFVYIFNNKKIFTSRSLLKPRLDTDNFFKKKKIFLALLVMNHWRQRSNNEHKTIKKMEKKGRSREKENGTKKIIQREEGFFLVSFFHYTDC